MKGIRKPSPNAGFPPEIMIRLGQKACDIAYGVLLAKSVGTGLHGIALPEVPPQAFLPPPSAAVADIFELTEKLKNLMRGFWIK
jgi:hypothetical protein